MLSNIKSWILNLQNRSSVNSNNFKMEMCDHSSCNHNFNKQLRILTQNKHFLGFNGIQMSNKKWPSDGVMERQPLLQLRK